MLYKFYQSEFTYGSCTNPGRLIYHDKFIEIDNDFKYIIMDNKKIKLGEPIIKEGEDRYRRWGRSWGPDLMNFRKTIYDANGKELAILELSKNDRNYKFDSVNYDGLEWRIKSDRDE